MMPKIRTLALLFVLLVVATSSTAQDAPPPQLNREQMWPAATAEEWKKPCLITWQRTWEDAQAVALETGKPILICVNMDGEIASEHYAGVRYRQPEIAPLYEPYVTVIASTYRHTPRDYDDQGRRILCPRFGSVTCGEHIAIEPILYEKYFDGERVAPRHIMVELDGSEQYDVYYRNDVVSVFEDIKKGIAEREAEPTTVVRGDRSIVERVASRDIVDRKAVETAYAEADEKLRRALLEAAKKQGSDVPIDLVRLGVFGLDVEMGKLARAALARTDSPVATDLITDALRIPMDDGEREALIGALERLGEKSEKARWLAVVHKGLASRSGAVDANSWAKAQKEYEASAIQRDLNDLAERQKSMAAKFGETPDDADACIELAEASLDLARKARKSDEYGIRMGRVVARHMFEDARHAASKAGKLGAEPWRVNTVLALAAYYRGEVETAYEFAEAAVKDLPPGEPGWNAMAVLTVFGEARYQAIKKAARARRRWPPQWLTDLDAAYSALLHHPMATDGQVLWHHEFLVWLGVNYRATRVLKAGLTRFPGSPSLHRQLRSHVLKTRGVAELDGVYREMLQAAEPHPDLDWYAGYASIVVAEYARRAAKTAEALSAYEEALLRYDRFAGKNPQSQGRVDHYVAMILAGRARLEFEAGEFDAAVANIIASFAKRPGTAGSPDGLGFSPAGTAQLLLARLKEQGKKDLAAKLEAELGKLDPYLLIPPEDRIPPEKR